MTDVDNSANFILGTGDQRGDAEEETFRSSSYIPNGGNRAGLSDSDKGLGDAPFRISNQHNRFFLTNRLLEADIAWYLRR